MQFFNSAPRQEARRQALELKVHAWQELEELEAQAEQWKLRGVEKASDPDLAREVVRSFIDKRKVLARAGEESFHLVRVSSYDDVSPEMWPDANNRTETLHWTGRYIRRIDFEEPFCETLHFMGISLGISEGVFSHTENNWEAIGFLDQLVPQLRSEFKAQQYIIGSLGIFKGCSASVHWGRSTTRSYYEMNLQRAKPLQSCDRDFIRRYERREKFVPTLRV